MRRVLVALCMGGLLVPVCGTGAWAQGFNGNQYGRTADPNMGHFYMGRQQIQIMDDAPAVNDMRTKPAPPGQAGRAAAAAGPPPLPKAGFVPYASTVPTMSSSLPKVVNGVPPKQLPGAGPGVNPKLAKAASGKFKGGKTGAGSGASGPGTGKAPASMETYAPYKGYGGGVPSGSSPASSMGTPGVGSSTAVSGSLLHWSRTGRKNY